MDEIAAVRAFQGGDMAAFRSLYERHAAHVYRTAYLIVLDRDRAEDIAQETFLALFQQLPRLAPGPLRSWLDRVAANLSLNERRRGRALPFASVPEAMEERLDVGDPALAADLLLEAAEERASLWSVVAALAPRQRAMIVLRYYCDCSLSEIAVTLGCRPGTVRATIHQALGRLRKGLAAWPAMVAE